MFGVSSTARLGAGAVRNGGGSEWTFAQVVSAAVQLSLHSRVKRRREAKGSLARVSLQRVSDASRRVFLLPLPRDRARVRRLSLRDQSRLSQVSRALGTVSLGQAFRPIASPTLQIMLFAHVDTAALSSERDRRPGPSLYPELARTSSQLEIACSTIGLPCNTYKHPKGRVLLFDLA